MHLVSVDFQNDFVSPGGVHYGGHPCVEFVLSTVVPFVRRHQLGIAEIVSDYRREGGQQSTTCVPGSWGYESAIPSDVTRVAPWVKASIAPSWAREGGGCADTTPGSAHPDPDRLSAWLEATVGPPHPDQPIVLLGLQLEVCVLATLIDLRLLGYPATVLIEGTDTADGSARRKADLLDTLKPFWGPPTTWAQCTEQMTG